MYFPAGSKRCPRCGTEFGPEEETIESILEELTALLPDDEEDVEVDEKPSTGKEPPDEVPKELDSASSRPDGKVRYKKVKRLPP